MTYAAHLPAVSRIHHHDLIKRLFRYAGVSAIATSVSLCILSVLIATNAVTAGWANVIATAVGTVPSFELNRRWVWNKLGKRSLTSEMAPFWALSFLGLGLSTLAVRSATSWASAHHLGAGARTAAATGASLATFGALWVIQYVILDRLLFRRRPSTIWAEPSRSPNYRRWRRLCSNALAAPQTIPSSARAGSTSARDAGDRS